MTKLAAEGLCRVHFLEYGLNCVVLRTGHFFPEEQSIELQALTAEPFYRAGGFETIASVDVPMGPSLAFPGVSIVL